MNDRDNQICELIKTIKSKFRSVAYEETYCNHTPSQTAVSTAKDLLELSELLREDE